MREQDVQDAEFHDYACQTIDLEESFTKHSDLYSSQMNFRDCCLRPLRNPHVLGIHSGSVRARRLPEKSSTLSILKSWELFNVPTPQVKQIENFNIIEDYKP